MNIFVVYYEVVKKKLGSNLKGFNIYNLWLYNFMKKDVYF